jgi:hypothetical protein
MRQTSLVLTAVVLSIVAIWPSGAVAQATRADYERATGLRARYEALAINVPGPTTWIEPNAFWYRVSVKGGHQFVLVDADTAQKRPPFDHEKLAASLSKVTLRQYTADTLPFTTFAFADKSSAVEVSIDGTSWKCSLADYACAKAAPAGPRAGLGPRPFACSPPSPDERPQVSPDGKWEALINNYNVAVRETGTQALTPLSFEGSEGNCYQLSSIRWSPDSKMLAAYRVKPGYRRMVHYVESSPEDQLQPKHSSLYYAKPGDVLDVEQPVLFHLEPRKQLLVDNALFPNAFDMSALTWRKDGRAITFEYNQRGHQVYRIIEAQAATGRPGPSSPKSRRRSSTTGRPTAASPTPAGNSASISMTARPSSGCRSGAGGATCICTTV